MPLKLTIEQLEELGFTKSRIHSGENQPLDEHGNGYVTWISMIKWVGTGDAFFYYWYRQFCNNHKIDEKVDHSFTLSSSYGGDTSVVVPEITCLEQFHDLETVLNKKYD